jgi:hypothetical protein
MRDRTPARLLLFLLAAAIPLMATRCPPDLGVTPAEGVLYGPRTFTREPGWPAPVKDVFTAPADGKALLRVFNGGLPDEAGPRVTSARFLLNGAPVVKPFRFNQRTAEFEVTLDVRAGLNWLVVHVWGRPGSAIAVQIEPLVPMLGASEQDTEAANQIRERLPGARAHLSQLHGGIALVQSGVAPEGSGFPPPLAEGRGDSADELGSAMLEYLQRHADAYGIDDAQAQFRIPEDLVNPGFDPVGREVFGQVSVPRSLGMLQLHQGVRVRGHYAVGTFDPHGNLQAMLTRILPAPSASAQPGFGPDGALGRVEAAFGEILQLAPELHWLPDTFAEAERAVELLWDAGDPRSPLPLRLVYEIQLRNGLNLALVQLDAVTGEIVTAADVTPSEWFDDGAPLLVAAPDEVGALQPIISTRDAGTWYMGFGNPFVDTLGKRYFVPGARLNVSDTAGKADLTRTYNDTITVADAGFDSWTNDPSYMGGRRAASSLVKNVAIALGYWRGFGWWSWNGTGGTLWTSINNNKSPTGSPSDRNAWGGSGVIQIGNGTAAGLTMAASAEIVGHEFMHNVISATSRLRYLNESGAVNEALADFFGVVLTAQGDRFNNDTIGEDSGAASRNLVNPSPAQPDRYSAYRLMSSDAGGVHRNSGIANKAHSLVVQGGSFRGFTVPAQGVAATADILRRANQFRVYGTSPSMEEFAAAVLGYCDLEDAFRRAFASQRITELCNAFALAYRATELLPGSITSDVSLDGVLLGLPLGDRGTTKAIDVVATNLSAEDSTLRNFDVLVSDELGEVVVADPEGPFEEACEARVPTNALEPGETKCLRTTIPIGVVEGYLTGIRNLVVELFPRTPQFDGELGNNLQRVRFGSDYTFDWVRFAERLDGDLGVVARLHNVVGGFPELRSVFLTRSTAHGALVPYTATPEDTSGEQPPAFDTNAAVTVVPAPVPGTLPEIDFIELAGAREIPGRTGRYQIWFDDSGGLAELEGREQIYVLVDSRDDAEETDESNNLMCGNCYAPGQLDEDSPTLGNPGVLVRLPLGVSVDAIFPEPYRDAAEGLPSEFPRLFQIAPYALPTLRISIDPVPVFPGPF